MTACGASRGSEIAALRVLDPAHRRDAERTRRPPAGRAGR